MWLESTQTVCKYKHIWYIRKIYYIQKYALTQEKALLLRALTLTQLFKSKISSLALLVFNDKHNLPARITQHIYFQN